LIQPWKVDTSAQSAIRRANIVLRHLSLSASFQYMLAATCLLADKLSIAFEPTTFDGIIDGIGEMYLINAVTFQHISRPIDD
jgi:hypothetical protein